MVAWVEALLDHVIIGFRPLASTVLENKDRHHACSEVKLSAISRGEIDLQTLLKSRRKMKSQFNWKALWLETQVSGSLSLSAYPDYRFKKWGLGSFFVLKFFMV